jgi:hypothetical protein
MVLDVADVVDVQLSAGEFAEAAGTLQDFWRFGGDSFFGLAATDIEVGKGLWLAQAAADSRASLIASTTVELAKLE